MVSKCGESLKDGSRSESRQRSEVLKIRLGFLWIFSTFSTTDDVFKVCEGSQRLDRSEFLKIRLGFLQVFFDFNFRWWFQSVGRVSKMVQGRNPVRDPRFGRSGWDSFGFFRLFQLLIMVSRCEESLRAGPRSESCQKGPSFERSSCDFFRFFSEFFNYEWLFQGVGIW